MKVDSPDGTVLNSNCDLCKYVTDRSKWKQSTYIAINRLCKKGKGKVILLEARCGPDGE